MNLVGDGARLAEEVRVRARRQQHLHHRLIQRHHLLWVQGLGFMVSVSGVTV